jgi:phosphoglycerol transferase
VPAAQSHTIALPARSRSSEWPGDRYLLAGALLLGTIVLVFRSIGLQPVVLADEYLYSKFARLVPFAAAAIPSYLYLALYRLTSVCGDGFLDCARVLNVALFIAAVPFVFAVARTIVSRQAATVIALATLAGPANSYTAYFMPDAAYWLAFWVFAWYLLRLRDADGLEPWCVAGVLHGIAALVKPHALLFLPAVVVYIVVAGWSSDRSRIDRPLKCALVLVAASLATKLAVGYVLAGASGLTLFGTLYGGIARNNMAASHYAHLVALAVPVAVRHALVVVALFAVPVAAGAALLAGSARSRQGLDAGSRVALLAALVVANLIATTAIFSAATENTARLHLRYYDFAFPLLLMLGALGAGADAPPRRGWRAAIAVVPAVAIVWLAVAGLRGMRGNLVDCPEWAGLQPHSAWLVIVSGLGLAALATWVVAPRKGARLYTFVVVPLAVVVSTVTINTAMRQRLLPDAYDRAGQFARHYLPADARGDVVVVGSERGEVYRALFHLDSAGAGMAVIPEGASYDMANLPRGRQWALVVGEHALVGEMPFALPMDGFVLARAGGPLTLDFRQPAWPGIIESASGLSYPEPWGRWSSAAAVDLVFARPLPRRFALRLHGRAFGPNAGAEIRATVGGHSATFTLGEAIEERRVMLDNPDRAKLLTISVPHPTAPRDLGLNADARTIGIGLVDIAIVPE